MSVPSSRRPLNKSQWVEVDQTLCYYINNVFLRGPQSPSFSAPRCCVVIIRPEVAVFVNLCVPFCCHH